MSFANIDVILGVDTLLFVGLSIAGLLCWLFVCYQVWRRLQRQPLWATGISLLNAGFIGLLLLMLTTDIRYHQSDLTPATLTLITSNPPNDASNDRGYAPNVVDVRKMSVSQIEQQLHGFSHFKILGDGFTSQQWRELQALRSGESFGHIETERGDSLLGFSAPSWNNNSVLGESVILTAMLAGNANDDNLYNAVLKDPIGNVVGQTPLRRGDTIEMAFVPVAVGQWQYQLSLESSSGEPLLSEIVAVNVTQGHPLKLSIMQSAPSFETRHLHNWLTARESQVVVNTQISRDSFSTQQFNLPAGTSEQIKQRLSDEQLTWADALILDSRTLSGLDDTEISGIRTSQQGGLGVVLIADNDLDNQLINKLVDKIDISVRSVEDEPALPRWPGAEIEEPIDVALKRLSTLHGDILVRDQQGRGLSVVSNVGGGQLVVTVIPSSYMWRLQGKPEQHSAYWQRLLSHVARLHQRPSVSIPTNDTLKANRSVQTLCVNAISAPQESQLISSRRDSYVTEVQALLFVPESLVAEHYCSGFVPTSKGWHRLEFTLEQQDETYQTSFFIADKDSWQAAEQQRKHSATDRQIANFSTQSLEDGITKQTLSKVWLFLIWLLIATLLWIEQKWGNGGREITIN